MRREREKARQDTKRLLLLCSRWLAFVEESLTNGLTYWVCNSEYLVERACFDESHYVSLWLAALES